MYGAWQIGGITPSFKITADYSGLNDGKLVLHCLARGNSKITHICNVSEGFTGSVKEVGESISLRKFYVDYREGEQVFLTRSLEGSDEQTIYADDKIRVISDIGEVTEIYGINQEPWIVEKPPLDISSILSEGINEIEIIIEDIYGWSIGCTPLALIKVGEDPRVEIGQFMDMQCSEVTNTKLINGGSRINVSGGEMVEITDGFYTWAGAIEAVKFKEDSNSRKHIEFDIEIQVEKEGKVPPTVYAPPFCNIPNIEYNEFTDLTRGQHEEIKIENNKWYQKYSAKKFPTIAGKASGSGCKVYCNWNNENAIKVADGHYSYAYLNSSSVGCTHHLFASGFGFNIPAKAEVTRVAAYVKYANNSRLRSPYFNKAWHSITLISPGMELFCNKNFSQGSTPDKPVTVVFDSAKGDFKAPKSPSYYNNPNFRARYASTLDKYKTSWVDYIYVLIEWQILYEDIIETPIIIQDPLIQENVDEECYAIGTLRIIENQEVYKVVVSGSACNLPAWIELNGIRKEWYTNHIGGGKYQSEVLEFILDPPTTELNFTSSTHKKYGYEPEDNKGCILDWIEVFYK